MTTVRHDVWVRDPNGHKDAMRAIAESAGLVLRESDDAGPPWIFYAGMDQGGIDKLRLHRYVVEVVEPVLASRPWLDRIPPTLPELGDMVVVRTPGRLWPGLVSSPRRRMDEDGGVVDVVPEPRTVLAMSFSVACAISACRLDLDTGKGLRRACELLIRQGIEYPMALYIRSAKGKRIYPIDRMNVAHWLSDMESGVVRPRKGPEEGVYGLPA